jgi:hypothetical protein
VNPQSCFSKDSIKGKPVLEKKSHPMKKEERKRKKIRASLDPTQKCPTSTGKI